MLFGACNQTNYSLDSKGCQLQIVHASVYFLHTVDRPYLFRDSLWREIHFLTLMFILILLMRPAKFIEEVGF